MKRNYVFLVNVIVTFIAIYKLTGSANFGKVLPMKLTSNSAVQVSSFYFLNSSVKYCGGGGKFGIAKCREHRLEVI